MFFSIRLQLDLDPNNLKKTGMSLAHPSLTDWIIFYVTMLAGRRKFAKQIGRWSFASWQIWPNMICGLQIPSIFISSRLSTQLSSGNPCISWKIQNIGWTNQTCEFPPENNILNKSEQVWLGKICRHDLSIALFDGWVWNLFCGGVQKSKIMRF